MKHARTKNNAWSIGLRRKATGVILFCLGALTGYYYCDQTREPPQVIQPKTPIAGVTVEPYFTPGDPCQKVILKEIERAQKSIYVQAYYLTSDSIAEALVEAHKRGVEVKVILDKSQMSNRSKAGLLQEAGIPIWVDNKVAIAHNKVMIFDGSRTLTGSYNFTQGAQHRNAENLLVINSIEIAQAYLSNWNKRQKVSKYYTHYMSLKTS